MLINKTTLTHTIPFQLNHCALTIQQQIKIMKKKNKENDYGHGVAWFRGCLLGKGAFGSVYLGTLKNPNSKYSYYPNLMAVKSAEVSLSASIQKEREVLNNIQGCTSIIRCFGDETTMGENGAMIYNLLLEYGSIGTLADKIKSSDNGKLADSQVKSYARSILRGLSHIHKLGYVHCDLKPDNIILVPVKTGHRAKIGDFGLAKREKHYSKKRKLETYWRGTPMYLSPEAVTDSVQKCPSDIWGFGCILYEMLTGRQPWDGESSEEILKRIGEGRELPKVPGEVSKEARDFLKCCFVRNPMFRFTAEMLLDHPFVENGLDDDDDGIEEVEEVEDLNEVELVAGFSDGDEFSCSFGSGDGLTSYLSDEEDDLDDVTSSFAEEGKFRVEDIETAFAQSNAKEISLEVPSKRRKDFTVGYNVIPAAV